jgi:5-enolpyruvylshikimate-3-phosphate synthase
MDKLIIEGGNRLAGRVVAAGAKNAALPLMAAALATEETVRISNIPHLSDITTMANLLVHMGVELSVESLKEYADFHSIGLDKIKEKYKTDKFMVDFSQFSDSKFFSEKAQKTSHFQTAKNEFSDQSNFFLGSFLSGSLSGEG